MKQTLLSGVAALALFAGAAAGSPAEADPPKDWSGPYVGGHLGYGEAYYDGDFNGAAGPPLSQDFSDLDLDGLVGGLHAGYNFQFGGTGGDFDFVVGIEGDVSFTDMNDSEFLGPPLTAGGSEQGIIGDVDLLASIRARLGVAVDEILLFVTGGVAFADADAGIFYSGTTVKFDFDDVGGVVGGGAEWALNETFSLRGEVLYYIFDDKKSTAGTFVISDPGDSAEFDDAFVVRFGVTVHLKELLANGI